MSDPEFFRLQPQTVLEPLDLASAFGRSAPIEIDFGSGEGSFLLARAAQFPERNFLGIERLLGRVRKTCRRAARAALPNVRILRLESAYTVRYLLRPATIRAAHLLFPDPWPKRRHHPRRLFNATFAANLCEALEPGGELFLKTDDPEYFRQMLRVAGDETRLTPDHRPFPTDYPQTDFERHFLAEGKPIHSVKFQRTPVPVDPLP